MTITATIRVIVSLMKYIKERLIVGKVILLIWKVFATVLSVKEGGKGRARLFSMLTVPWRRICRITIYFGRYIVREA
jgi:hypothetical protein